MRPVSVLLLLLFVVLFRSCHLAKKAGYEKKLNDLYSAVEKNAATVQLLQHKKDSIAKTGNLFDTVATGVQTGLLQYTGLTDSIKTKIEQLRHKINFRVTYWEEYAAIKANIRQLSKYISIKQELWQNDFTRIHKILNESDLSGQKKELTTMLNNASEQQQKEVAAIGAMASTKDSLLQQGNINPEISDKIDVRLFAYRKKIDSISNEIQILNAKLETPGEFKKDFTIIKAKIILIDSVVNKNATTKEFIFKMIEDGMAKSNKKLFNLAAFFGPGGYSIPQEKYPLARQYFTPIIDSLMMFSNNYASLFRTASIMVSGYADAANIAKNTPLHKKLSGYLKNPNPTREELNTALSALRAEEIARVLNLLIKEKVPDFVSIDKVTFESLETGEGEKLPNPVIADYRKNDERRRVVLIYWSVLPDSN
jgi:outer membrane murein-binding lipoprotein Lpp